MTIPKTDGQTPVARLGIASPVMENYTPPDLFEPDNLLGALFSDMMHGRPVNALTRHWLEKGILNALRRGESLDESLGLSGVGRTTLQTRLLMLRRNEHLAAALAAVAIDDSLGEWQRCLRLAPLVTRFLEITWPKARRLLCPADDWPEYKKHLWHAACCDIALPESAHGLRKAVNSNPPFSVNNSGARLLARLL